MEISDSLSKHERKVSIMVISFINPIVIAYSLLGNGGRESEGQIFLFTIDETEINETRKLEMLPT